jgi:auxin efflux carrier family
MLDAPRRRHGTPPLGDQGIQLRTCRLHLCAAGAELLHSAPVHMLSFGATDLFSLHPTLDSVATSSFDEQAVRTTSAATKQHGPKEVHMFEWSSGASTTF